ncbi:MAG TPA: DEAD/DEAH box helicase [Longimicrobiales bacterium]|nr:DEAD/DEAH box helicase [Longimicrobiales bacterium]
MTFDEMNLAEPLRRAVKEQGWERPTPIQSKAIGPAREGRDVVGIAQTGTGKTAGFLLPSLEKQLHKEGLHTLVLCPTRELADQVMEDAKALTKHTELFCGVVVGGMPMRPQIRDLRAGFDVLVATPGRLLDHLERGNVKLDQVETLILDEADRMLDMGFRPQIEAIMKYMPTKRQTLFFSATMPNGVHALALRILNDPVWVEAAPQATVADHVEQKVYSVRSEKKSQLLIELLKETHWDQVLVFTATKAGADVLIVRLERAGIKADVMHGNKDMKQRRKALEAFADGKVQVLVATDVAQRGLDIEGISHVVNYDVPRDPEAYVHRIGRTGRAGASGSAVTFMSGLELAALKDIERVIGYRIERVSLPEYDYAGSPVSAEAEKAKAVVNRGGGRMGSKSASALSPEQLKELMRVG